MRSIFKSLVILCGFLVFLAAATRASAATTWVDLIPGDDQWSSGGNWSAGIPDINDDVTFPSPAPLGSNGNVFLNGSNFARSLVFLDGYQLFNGSLVLGTGSTNVASGKFTSIFSALGGSSGLTKLGAGTLTLTGNNIYSGPTNVSQGTLNFAAANERIPNASAVFISSGATLGINSGVTQETIGSLAGGGSLVFGNAGGTNLQIGADNTSTVFSGTITQSAGIHSLTKIGTGKLTLSGPNTYSGGTTINDGTLALAGNSAFGAGTLTVLGGAIEYLSGINIANAINLQQNATLTIVGGSSTQSGVIAETAGPFGITKTGAGTLVLTNTNTYTGPVTVSAGTLLVNGGSTPSSLTDISATGTLQISAGMFKANGNLTVNTTGSLTLATTGHLNGNGANGANGAASVPGAPGAVGSVGRLITLSSGTVALSNSSTLSLNGGNGGNGARVSLSAFGLGA